jgi:L-ribulose-5-phosphate 4-epimerase
MLEKLREEVLEANLEIVRRGLVLYTWGNGSGIDRETRLVVIKPSGVPYDTMKPSDLVITDLDGAIVEGSMRPSSDLATHLALYRAFPKIGGIIHTHSKHATIWAQACKPIPCLGTTHADYFHGPVLVTDHLTADEIEGEYEENTGTAIVRMFQGTDGMSVPAILVAGHAPFCWAKNVMEAAKVAVVLEEVAYMALQTLLLNPSACALQSQLHDKHFLRKHGANAYYGQKIA